MSASQPAPPLAQGRRLLIVDDEVDFAVSTSRALAFEGIGCHLAHDGAGAVQAVMSGGYDIALIDIRIRDEDGTALAARLTALHPGLITIIMTGYASVDSTIAALQAGAQDFLRKPFFLDELMRSLTRGFEVLRLREEKARAERELTLLHQLEASAQLAAGLSHDFRNMLAVVQANLSVLTERLAGNAALLPYASDAAHAAQAATSLVTRLTGLIRNRAAPPVATDLRGPLQAAVEMMRRTLCAGIRLDLTLPEEPLVVLADPSMIETALVNLMINARDATADAPAPHVSIRLSRIAQGGDYARLVVEDNGSGLSAEAAAGAGEPFFTTKQDGIGLGLPMIRHFALTVGGQFRLINLPEGGARAVLDMPVSEPPLERPKPAPQATPPQPGGENI